jgi:transposase InsO family protein
MLAFVQSAGSARRAYPATHQDKGAKANYRRAASLFTLCADEASMTRTVTLATADHAQVQVRVPLDEQEVWDAAYRAHAQQGHLSRDKMLVFLQRELWLKSWHDIATEVPRHCTSCTRARTIGRKSAAPLQMIATSRPLEKLVFDFTDLGSETQAPFNRYMLVIVDHFTKFIWAKAFPAKDAAPVAEYLYNLYCTEGRPDSVLSDNGSEFVNAVLRRVHERLDIDEQHGRPYRPQTQGLVERANRTLKEKVCASRVGIDPDCYAIVAF